MTKRRWITLGVIVAVIAVTMVLTLTTGNSGHWPPHISQVR